MPDAVIVPLAIEYTFWNERKPEALVRFGAPIEVDEARGRGVAEWTARLEQRLAETMDALPPDAMSRDPALFRPLVQRPAGVGGIYDLWRARLARLGGGRRFDPLAHDHGARADGAGE